MLMANDALTLRAKFFRGLADASRLALLLALREGEKNVTTLIEETGLTQSNVSGHLACLKDCGLVESRQEWRNVYYRLADERVEGLLRAADEILAITAERVSRCVNYSADDVKDSVKECR
ncbi:metalloregulator ArsR/SmtB family transcription factor [Alicyclobacillus fastidiosus]|uniref:Metalloregulator ArsR/SmtB family transcription factor n=1 Tax=Alicyclobacillus fastidiosus TaxID=392011 RepID=A0ABY6ZMH0_9BACL|nr:metalloregulator ArsR/SmtB family transcription factor [Alicyclobacillus fastidiosus]WAH44041.1 metalloregulator ArsR/SmtB family transcription factor [Alicyclobacillus fastidiosus]GMA60330.1 hypothetical protein GCM10025859_07700 [Alicyclobacillus fastidiosus]